MSEAGAPDPAELLGPRRVLSVSGTPVEFHDVPSRVPSAPTLVLHHGGQCTAADFAVIVESLAQRYRLILPDRFVTNSIDPWHVWRLLDHLGVGAAAMLGHSAGGTVMRQMYRLAPQRVLAMVDVDSSALGTLILARKLPDDRLSPVARELHRRHAAEVQKLRSHHRGDYPTTVTLERRFTAYARESMTPEERRTCRPPAVPVGSIDAGTPPTPIADTGKFITCPCLLVHTGRGKLGPEDITPEWIDQHLQATDVEYVVIRESGHWPWLENTEHFLQIVEPFLARTLKPGDCNPRALPR